MTDPIPTEDEFRLGTEALTDESRLAALDTLNRYYRQRQRTFIGYQTNQALKDNVALAPFLSYHINNVGDPFVEGYFRLHSRWVERAVLDHYARLWHASIPADRSRPGPDDYWGYVLSTGSTEGNLYALWNARDYLSGEVLLRDGVNAGLSQAQPPTDNPNAYTPVAFFSEDTHYSHLKGMEVLRIPTFYDLGAQRYPGQCPIDVVSRRMPSTAGWPVGVPSEGGDEGPGSVDVDALVSLVDFFAGKGHPILICFNVGSTFKGACDDVERGCARLRPVLERHGLIGRQVHYDPDHPDRFDIRDGYWIHVDGALGATYVPYLEKAKRQVPVFDFRVPEVTSIVASGHKYPGAPFPTGIYMSKLGNQLRPPSDPAVIASPDSTFAGSRNGLAPITMWNWLAQLSEADHIDMAVRAVELADYASRRLSALSRELAQRAEPWAEDGIEVGHTDLSLSVWFQQPNRELVAKYSLACVPLDVDGVEHDYSHMYVMPHVTRELIDELVNDLSKPGAFDRSGEDRADANQARNLGFGTLTAPVPRPPQPIP